MNERENLHDGHRERMLQKFFINAKGMPEHELLEVLLFYAIPRKDTNGLAHRLLRTFGTLEKLFSASTEEVSAVDGVGKRTAVFIKVVCEIYKSVYKSENKKKKEQAFSFGNNVREFLEYFSGMTYERFIIKLYDQKHNPLTMLEFEDKNKDEVTGDIPEIAKAFAINKPTYAIIAHNHPSGNCFPSEADDFTTIKIYLLCFIHGVWLSDHIIIANNKAFSYFQDGRLDYIRDKYNIETLLKSIKEK